MKRSRKACYFVILAGILALICTPIRDVMAANTVFMHPDFGMDPLPITVYYSNHTNVQIYKESYGICADIDNLSGIGAAIQEVSDHVNEKSGKHFVMGVITNGEDFTANDINAIVSDGWERVECYYYDYMVSINPVSTAEDFLPRVWNEEDDQINQILKQVGYEEQVALVGISGVNQPLFGVIYYQPNYNFLKGKQIYGYKYMPHQGCFVPVNEAYYGSFDPYFLDMYGIDNIDGSANGTFLLTSHELPEAIVASADSYSNYISPYELIRETDLSSNETGGSPELDTEVEVESEILETDQVIVEINSAEETEKDVIVVQKDGLSEEEVNTYINQNQPMIVKSEDGRIEWRIENVQKSVAFLASAKIEVVDDTDVSVDFKHSGELPGEAFVTIGLDSTGAKYTEGEELYLYYKNLQTQKYELTSTGKYEKGKASFWMTHCSEYIITSQNRGDNYQVARMKFSYSTLLMSIGGMLFVLGIMVIIVIRLRKDRK